jgi:hypothetical protein
MPQIVKTFLIALIPWAVGMAVYAQDMPDMDSHTAGHAKYHDFYQHWMQPGSSISCCNARVTYPGGGFVGDCYPTTAELRPSADPSIKGEVWWALRAPEDGGGWIEIPDSKIIREHNPDPTGQDAHLCYSYGTVLCFVPPSGSM